jgi:hypothetical protein
VSKGVFLMMVAAGVCLGVGAGLLATWIAAPLPLLPR